MFVKIDRFALSVAERIAHFIQRNFGIKPISIALGGDVLFACSLISGWFIPGVTVSTTSKFIDVLMFIVIFLSTIVVYPRDENDIERDAASGLSNKNKINPIQQAFRILSLFVFALSLLHFCNKTSLESLNNLLKGLGILIALYFIACDPLPPTPSRFRKLLESLFGRTSVIRN
jgi:hypothetical protein